MIHGKQAAYLEGFHGTSERVLSSVPKISWRHAQLLADWNVVKVRKQLYARPASARRRASAPLFNGGPPTQPVGAAVGVRETVCAEKSRAPVRTAIPSRTLKF